MINDFVVAEDLHLLHLGIMKKLLLIWKDGLSNFEFKWNNDDIKNLNEMLKRINSCMPTEIHRSTRSIDYLKFWKGTELRTFLLYIGIVVLKTVLRDVEYMHFVKLFCAVTLCYTDKYINKNRGRMSDLIRELFNEYIEDFIDIYGPEYVSSNVHNLSHVIDDVLRFGNLTKISAYQFENSLFSLKLRLRTCDKPLEQIARRISELDLDHRNAISEIPICETPIVKYPFQYEEQTVFGSIILNEIFFLNKKNIGDKWFLSDCGKIVEFHFALKHDDEYLVSGYCIENLNNFFTQPFSSNKIYIFSGVIKKSYQITHFKLKNVMAKMICMQRAINSTEFVFMPLLHTLK